MFVIWSSHNDHLKGHRFGNYKPAMAKRSGKILLLSNLASPLTPEKQKKQMIPLLSIRACFILSFYVHRVDHEFMDDFSSKQSQYYRAYK